MAMITLHPGEKLVVEFHDCDGQFEIHFDTEEYPKSLLIKETDGLKGNVAGGAHAILYEEHWAQQPGDEASEVERAA